jgi:precorrin-8X/cobalt-precorrin-8 methylmutase
LIHPIEVESYRILADRIDLSHLPSGPRAIIERVIHASADLDYASTMIVDDGAVEAGIAAITAGSPVITDVEMTRAGITGVAADCFLAEASASANLTRSAAAIRAAVAAHPDGAVFVIGCAPTALVELVRRSEAGDLRPALVIGMPVGFVGAAESKELARHAGFLSITNVGEKGGSAVAAAAFNALVRLGAP